MEEFNIDEFDEEMKKALKGRSTSRLAELESELRLAFWHDKIDLDQYTVRSEQMIDRRDFLIYVKAKWYDFEALAIKCMRILVFVIVGIIIAVLTVVGGGAAGLTFMCCSGICCSPGSNQNKSDNTQIAGNTVSISCCIRGSSHTSNTTKVNPNS